jgi:mono/diheme cytochrome c family protein
VERNARRPDAAPIALAFLLALLASCGPSEPAARVFYRRCAACHGMDGKGRTKIAQGRPFADLTDGKWKHGGDRASIRRLVAEGEPGSVMPPFRDKLTPEEIDLSVDYVLRVAGGAGGNAPAPAAAPR